MTSEYFQEDKASNKIAFTEGFDAKAGNNKRHQHQRVMSSLLIARQLLGELSIFLIFVLETVLLSDWMIR